jgi:antitoxin component of MazEF toxin-antitoxin module
MIKFISTSNYPDRIELDQSLQQLAHLKAGDEVHVEVQPDGAIRISLRANSGEGKGVSELIESTMDAYATTMKRLA